MKPKLFKINKSDAHLSPNRGSSRGLVPGANQLILRHLAPQVGFEPTTLRLTAESSRALFSHIGSGLDEPRLPRRVWFWARPRRRVATLGEVGAGGATWANVTRRAAFYREPER